MPDHPCRPPSPAHTAADCSVTTVSRRFRYYSVVRLLTGPRFPLHLSTYRVAYPAANGDPTSSPGVTLRSSVPCRPQTPWCDGWMSDAFASIVQARPCPIFGRPVHQWGRPLDYGPVLLLMPFGFHLTVDTLPSGCSYSPASEALPPLLDIAPLIRALEGL